MKVRRIIVGPPGAGKTQRLLRVMERALARGVKPERIAFVGFTRAAVKEAKSRASARFGLDEKSLVHFRTVHSFCFNAMGFNSSDVVASHHLRELGEMLGEDLGAEPQTEDGPATAGGSVLMTLDNYARTTMKPLEVAHHDADQDVEWFRLKRFVDAYRMYKEDRGLVDFTDMLQMFVDMAFPADVDVAIVDEGQDLSALQWKVIDVAFGKCDELWIAGDDDQSIYKWSGADPDRFLSLPYEREVLPVSFRLPSAIFDLSQEIVSRVSRRFPKPCRADRRGGLVDWIARADEIDLSAGTWLLLARTRYQLRDLEKTARDQGVVYAVSGKRSVDEEIVRAIVAYENLRKGWRIEGTEAALAMRAAGRSAVDIDQGSTYTAEEMGLDVGSIWHDALVRIPLDDREYYLACRRRGELLHEEPRVRIDTIHGAKGAEAEKVLLLTDLTYRIQKGYEREPDDEHRVFFVGATRASQELYLSAPRSAYGYAL